MIDACVELLGEIGRADLNRDRIARRAGVSLPAVNRRFASVDAILEAIASTPLHTPGALPADDLRAHLVAKLTRAARTLRALPIRRAAAELVAAATGDAAIDAAFSGSLAAVRGETLAVVARAKERGDLPPGADGELLLDLLDGALYYRLLWRDEALAEADVPELVDTVLAGFRARAG